MLKIILRTIFMFAVILLGYYLLAIRPQIMLKKEMFSKQKEISMHYTTLAENKLSLIELINLNPTSASFDYDKTNLVEIIQETKKTGLEQANNAGKQEIVSFYNLQTELLNKVFATDSYEAGIEILRSEESINLLLKQTQLIQEFEEQLLQLKERTQALQLYPEL